MDRRRDKFAAAESEFFLRRILEVEKLVHEIGPEEIKEVPLISMD